VTRPRSRIAARALLLISLAALGPTACGERVATVEGGDLGRVRLFQPSAPATGFVFLLSDGSGWSHGFDRAAKRLRDAGMIVAGVDTAQVMRRLRSMRESCIDMRAAFETASQMIQKGAGVGVYRLPVLAGSGEGATLALAGLWQAGPETFAGAATVNFRPRLRSRTALCADTPPRSAPDGTGWIYTPPRSLTGWWRAAWTAPPAPADALRAATLAGADIVAAAPDATPARLLAKLVDRAGAADEQKPLMLGDLAVVDLPGRPGSDTAVMILSGDGGWRDLDRRLGGLIADAGVPVIGIDCLRYFWSARSPETAAADLDRLIADVAQRTGVSRIALVGFSFGADVLPAIYNRLGPDTRNRVVLLSLLAPGRDAHFEIHLEGWLGGSAEEGATPLAPEFGRIDTRLVQCIYGEEETDDSGCLDARLQTAQVVRMSGGHHFDEDYPALAQRILQRLRH